MDIFRKIFGLNRSNDKQYHQYHQNVERNDFLDDSDDIDLFDRKGFEIFTDPLQMHQYFEHQMNEILKSFGFQEFDHFSTIDSPNIPALDVNPFQNDQSSGDLRDQFLKPGYVKPKNHSEMVDKDLDDQIKTGDLNSVLSEEQNIQITPFKSQRKNYFYSHGSSQSIKSITKPDGSIKTHCTSRDSQGNEESTVCHKIGDKEYCVIRKKNKQGNEETTETFVNMTEDEKDIFLNPKITNTESTGENFNSDFPWANFFK